MGRKELAHPFVSNSFHFYGAKYASRSRFWCGRTNSVILEMAHYHVTTSIKYYRILHTLRVPSSSAGLVCCCRTKQLAIRRILTRVLFMLSRNEHLIAAMTQPSRYRSKPRSQGLRLCNPRWQPLGPRGDGKGTGRGTPHNGLYREAPRPKGDKRVGFHRPKYGTG